MNRVSLHFFLILTLMFAFSAAQAQEIGFNPEQLQFGEVPVGATGNLTLTINNDGEEDLIVQAMLSDNENFEAEFENEEGPHFQWTQTDVNHSVLINEFSNNGENFALGDEIGVFTPDGLCAGGAIVVDVENRLAPALFGDDAQTQEVDGFAVGEPFTFRYWDDSAWREMDCDVQYVAGQQAFAVNGFTVVLITVGENLAPDDIAEMTIEPGQSLDVNVAFTPDAEGDYEGILTVFSNAIENPEATIALTGTGISPEPNIVIAEREHDFGSVMVGESVDWTFTIGNDGTANLNVEFVTTEGNGFIDNINEGFIVEPNASNDVVVTFTPEEGIEYAGSVTISSDDADEDVIEINLLGVGSIEELPQIGFEPAELEFGNVQVGGSEDAVLTISNSGNADLVVFAVQSDNEVFIPDFENVEGPHFAWINTDVNHSLLINEILLDGEPLAVGDEIGILTQDGLCAGGVVISEEGASVGPAAFGDDAQTDEVDGFAIGEPFAFSYWDASAWREVEAVPNYLMGPQVFAVNGFTVLTLSNGERLDPVDVAEMVVAPGESFDLSVSFAPDAEADFNGTLTIISNDPENGQAQITMTGAGVQPEPDIELSAMAHDFQDVVIGDTRDWVLNIANNGAAELTIESIITETIDNDGDYFSDDIEEAFVIGVGENVDVTISFTPDDQLEYFGLVTILSNDPDSGELAVELTGVGTVDENPIIIVNPEELDFGTVLTDRTAEEILTIGNDGNTTLHVSALLSDNEAFVPEFENEEGVHFQWRRSDISHTFLVQSALLNDQALAVGDEIGAITPDGFCAGSVVIQEEGADVGFAAWGDDAQTEEIDGFVTGDAFVFCYWDAASWREIEASPSIVQGPDHFAANGMTIMSLSAEVDLAPVEVAEADIEPGETVDIAINFTPPQDGEYNAILRVLSNDRQNPEVEVRMNGVAEDAMPAIELSEAAHDFGDLSIGSRDNWTFTIFNNGDADLNIESIITVGESFHDNIDDVLVVEAGGSADVVVSCEPVAEGNIAGSTTITSNDPEQPELVIQLLGFGLPAQNPEIAFSPEVLDFGGTQANQQANMVLTISNVGELDLSVNNIVSDNELFWADFGADEGPRYDFATTDVSHSLLFNEVVLNDEALVVGDEIGVFTPAGLCAGGAIVEEGEDQIGGAAWADDAQTDEIEGFAANEEFEYRIWDASAWREYRGEPRYLMGPQVFAANGFTVLTLTAGGNLNPADVAEVMIEPGGSIDVDVHFLPVEEGEFAATFTVISNDPNNPEAEIAAVGFCQEPAPDISVSEMAHDFGEVVVDQSRQWMFAIGNEGGEDLLVESVTTEGDYFTDDVDGEISLAPGETSNVTITFTPEIEGEYNGIVTILSNDEDTPEIIIDLAGLAILNEAPVIIFEPLELEFGNVMVDEEDQMMLTIFNDGAVNLVVDAIESDIEEVWADFEIEEGPHFRYMSTETNHSLLIQESTIDGEILVVDDEVGVFTTNGLCAGGWIVEVDGERIGMAAFGDDAQTQEVDGFGEGEEFAFRIWDLSARREYMAVPSYQNGPQAFTNNGFTVLTLEAEVGLNPANPAQLVIAPGEWMDVPVHFAPTEVRDYEGVLTVLSNDPNTPEANLRVTGRGVLPEANITLSAMAHDFGELFINESDQWTLTIGNNGGNDLTVSSVVTAGDYFSDDSDGEIILAPFETADVIVTFAPEDVGQFAGIITIASDDGDEPELVVQLNGSAVDNNLPIIVIEPMELDFGDVIVGEEAQTVMTISNDGGENLIIEAISSDIEEVWADFEVEEGPHFRFVGTESNHSLLIQESTIDGEALVVDDEVGVFTTNDFCAGAWIVQQDGERIGMGAFGDDAQTQELDGFQDGEEFSFRIWDASAYREYNATPNYQNGPHVFANNGFTVLTLTADIGLNPANPAQLVIEPGGSVDIPVYFAPTEERDYEGVLTVVSNDPEYPEVDLTVIGRGFEPAPNITLSAMAHNFGGVLINDRAEWSLTVSNDGFVDLTVSEITTDGMYFSDNYDNGFVLQPGASEQVMVTFAPEELGDFDGTVTIISDSPGEEELIVGLSGSGVDELMAQIEVRPEALNFGEVTVGERGELELVISNVGGAPLTINSVESNDAAFVTNFDDFDEGGPHFRFTYTDASHSLLIQETLLNGEPLVMNDEIGVFTPDGLCAGGVIVEVEQAGQLGPAAWQDDQGTDEVDGFRAGEAMSFRIWDYSAQREYDAEPQLIQGQAVFATNGFTIMNLNAGEQLNPMDQAQVSLEPGESLTLTVTFFADEIAEYEGMLTILSDDQQNPEVLVQMLGVGVPELIPVVELSTEEIDFGDVAVDDIAERTITITNAGNTDLNIESVIAFGECFGSDGNEGFVLAPEESRDITVSFFPLSVERYVGGLSITSDDPETPVALIWLYGNGFNIVPELSISEFSGDFGDVVVGSSVDHIINFANNGNEALEVFVYAHNHGAEVFSLQGEMQTEFIVDPDEDVNVAVTFSPTAVEEFEGELAISTNDPANQEISYVLRGHGLPEDAPEIVINEVSFDFGATPVGSFRTLDLTGWNIGGVDLNISEMTIDNNAVFSVDFDPEQGLVVSPGEEFAVSLTFTPEAEEEYAGVLTVISNDEDEGELTFDLMGVGIPEGAHFRYATTELNESLIVREALLNGEPLVANDEIGVFTPAGLCAGAVTITEEQWGNSAGLAAWGDDDLTEEIDGFAPGETKNWRVWDASAGREYVALAQYIEGNDVFSANVLTILTLRARDDVFPIIQLSSVEHNYGRVLIGNASGWTLEVANIGNANLELAEINFNDEAFSTPGFENDEVLLPGEAMDIEVVFEPAEAGDYAATMTLFSNDPQTPESEVSLMGVGVEPADPEIFLSEAEFNFGDVFVNDVAERTLTIANTGEGNLVVDRLVINDNNFAVEPSEGFTLGLDESRDVTVYFIPDDTRDYDAELVIVSNDPNNAEVSVALTGTGLERPYHWDFTVTQTGMSLIINEIVVDDEVMDFGGDVGVFTPDGLCGGAEYINDYPLGLTAWTDDAETEEVDGFHNGDEMFFRIWDPVSETELEATAEYIQGDGIFFSDDLAILTLSARSAGFRHFPEVTPTDLSHSLLVDNVVMNGEVLTVGDEIGVYTPLGFLAGSYQLDAPGDVRLGFPVWSDDGTTDEIDGFRAGEPFTFVAWDNETDSEAQLYPEWIEGPQVFQANGFTTLTLSDNEPLPVILVEREHDFGQVVVNEMRVWEMEIANDGDADLVIDEISVSGEVFAVEFEEPLTIGIGEFATVDVEFTPTDLEEYQEILTIQSNDPDNPQVNVTLIGVGTEENHPPVLVGELSDIQIQEDSGQTVVGDLDELFMDADGDELTFEVDAIDELNFVIDQENVLSFQPDADYFGESVVTLIVDDGFDGQVVVFGGSIQVNFAAQADAAVLASSARVRFDNDRPNRDDAIQESFGVNVTPVNDAPFWVNVPDQPIQAGEGDEIEFDLEADDVDDDVLNLAVADAPDGSEVVRRGDKSWNFTWMPSFHEAGEYSITFTVTDEAGLSDEVVVAINVDNVNRAPEAVRPIEDAQFDEDSGIHAIADLDDVFLDPDGDQMTYTFSTDDDNLNVSLDERTNILAIDPTEHYWTDGSEVTVTADDGNEGVLAVRMQVSNIVASADNAFRSATRSVRQVGVAQQRVPQRDDFTDDMFEVVIIEVNDDPFWVDPVDEFGAEEGDLVEFILEADDFDFIFDPDEEITLAMAEDDGLRNRGAEWTVDEENHTGTFSWQTGFNDDGVYHPIFIVSDDDASDEIMVEITVMDNPQAPYITEPTEEETYEDEIAEGEEILIPFTAEDADDDPENLSWTVSDEGDIPEGWIFEDFFDGTAEFSWTPGPLAGRAEPYVVEFTVTDTDNQTDVITVLITVTDVNHMPEFVDPVNDDEWDVEATEGEELRFHVEAEDIDLDDLEYSAVLDALPGDPQIVDDGAGIAFVWTPPFEEGHDQPVYDVRFDVTDNFAGNPGQDILVVHITVRDLNRGPEVVNPMDDIVVDEDVAGQPVVLVDLSNVFRDPDGDNMDSYRIEGAPDEVTLAVDGNNLTLAMDENFNLPGGVDISIWAVDEFGLDSEAPEVFNLVITPVNDAPGAFDLLAPADNTQIPDNQNNLRLDWADAANFDGDVIRYSVYTHAVLGDIDTTASMLIGEESEVNIDDLHAFLVEMGVYVQEDGVRLDVEWWVVAEDDNDEPLSTESNQHWTINMPIPNSVSNGSDVMPSEFSLSQNYPNPFNPTTRMEYSLPHGAEVRLDVMDLNGRRIASLVDGYKTAGVHTAEWNAEHAPGGMYLIVMQVENRRYVSKALLVK